jgi:hypothetical protein
VVRKLPIDDKLLNIILQPILCKNDKENRYRMDIEIGISELLFEVTYGASEGLHSRAK